MKRMLSLLVILAFTNGRSSERPVTIAILAKDKAHTLPTFLMGIENQTINKKNTYIYIRTNNNTDNTAQILKDWALRVENQYLGIYFDSSDVKERVQDYGQHEWNCTRFKVLGKIRQESMDWAYARGSHYFVVDCDNFILPNTLESLISVNLPIVAPLLYSNNAYSNYHSNVDGNGYHASCPYYLTILNREIKGLIELPVVHCTYLVRHEVLNQMSYDDESYRYEYVIFSDNARKKGIPQYLDTRQVYGNLTLCDTDEQLRQEPWFLEFHAKFFKQLMG
jgi:Glycosyl transferase family 2